MRKTTLGRIACLMMALAWLAPSHRAAAQVADVSGTWNLEVTTDQGVTRPSVTFEQDDGSLTGSYSSEALGQNRVRGSVEGSTVTWSFSADLQGQSVPVRYRGTLTEDGTMTGTIDIAGGMLTGSFSATRGGT
jgi:hypothetical protein